MTEKCHMTQGGLFDNILQNYMFSFFDSAIQLLQIYLEDTIPTIQNICPRLFIEALFVIKNWKQPSYLFIGDC